MVAFRCLARNFFMSSPAGSERSWHAPRRAAKDPQRPHGGAAAPTTPRGATPNPGPGPRHGDRRRRTVTLDELTNFPWVGPSFPPSLTAGMSNGDRPCGSIDKTSGRFHPRVLAESFASAKRIVPRGRRPLRGAAVPDRSRNGRRRAGSAADRAARHLFELRLHRQARPCALARRRGVHGSGAGCLA